MSKVKLPSPTTKHVLTLHSLDTLMLQQLYLQVMLACLDLLLDLALFPCLLWEKNCCRIVRASYVLFQSLRDRSPSGSSLWRSMVSKSPAVANVASTLDMSSEEIRSLDKSGIVS